MKICLLYHYQNVSVICGITITCISYENMFAASLPKCINDTCYHDHLHQLYVLSRSPASVMKIYLLFHYQNVSNIGVIMITSISQWKTSLQSNGVTHWLGAKLGSPEHRPPSWSLYVRYEVALWFPSMTCSAIIILVLHFSLPCSPNENIVCHGQSCLFRFQWNKF